MYQDRKRRLSAVGSGYLVVWSSCCSQSHSCEQSLRPGRLKGGHLTPPAEGSCIFSQFEPAILEEVCLTETEWTPAMQRPCALRLEFQHHDPRVDVR